MYMVFEYMEHDLTGVLHHNAVVYGPQHIKCLIMQLFKGLEHLHANDIIHRDIKGANMLLNSRGVLKLADFGLARRRQIDMDSGLVVENFEYTNRVVTLWYRAPELLLGLASYSFEIDVWSAGCIMAEFYTKQALFQGRNEIDQLEVIAKICGSFNSTVWPGITEMPWHSLFSYDDSPRVLDAQMEKLGASKDFISLIESVLCYDYKKRPTASQALQHAYFTTEAPKACLAYQYIALI